MVWLFRRTFVVWLILSAISASVVLIARANRAPDRLQAIGFDVCEGDLCFRGIKRGMAWEQARNRIPEAFPANNALVIPILESANVYIISSRNKAQVENIATVGIQQIARPLSAGEIVARYGAPCYLVFHRNASSEIQMHYPNLVISLNAEIAPSYVTIAYYRVELSTIVYSIQVSRGRYPNPCGNGAYDSDNESGGPWYGFTSNDVYRARFRRFPGAAE